MGTRFSASFVMMPRKESRRRLSCNVSACGNSHPPARRVKANTRSTNIQSLINAILECGAAAQGRHRFG